jgi:hypothetical protein
VPAAALSIWVVVVVLVVVAPLSTVVTVAASE